MTVLFSHLRSLLWFALAQSVIVHGNILASKRAPFCPTPPSKNDSGDCIRINNWGDFRSTIQQNEGRMVLCPFRIIKRRRRHEKVVINGPKEIICQQPLRCFIQGPGIHIQIRGRDANATLQGISFIGATKASIRVQSTAGFAKHQICDCRFERNHGVGKTEGAIKIAPRSTVQVGNCEFNDNWGSESGAINSRGDLAVFYSTFQRNVGELGGAITSAGPDASLQIQGNEFRDNAAVFGPAVYDKALKLFDYGENSYWFLRDVPCSGVYFAVNDTCHESTFTRLNDPRETWTHQFMCKPSEENASIATPSRPKGYFNYDINDAVYGPSNWQNVDTSNSEWTQYPELNAAVNRCNSGNAASPINLGGGVTTQCDAFHEFRTTESRVPIDGEFVTFSITPTRLRIDFSESIPAPRRASIDLPNNFRPANSTHVEVVIPSEHTLNGYRYDGEYIVTHYNSDQNRITMVSALIEATGKKPNRQFQELLDEWSKVETCGLQSPDRRILREETASKHQSRRRLPRRRFDIYHYNLLPSIHFHAYVGTTTDPPCLDGVHRRIVDLPMVVSLPQLEKLRELLSNGPCLNDSMAAGLGDCFARPTQPLADRMYWTCNPADFLSDCVRFGQSCDWLGSV